MENSLYRPRIIDSAIKEKLALSKAVCIQGPKASGKTWASLNQASSALMLGDSANNFANRRLTMLDVSFALKGAVPHLIDEWQEVPSIWDAVRNEVDKSPEKGRFILTGSSTPANKGIMHTGTGRISLIDMRTMSLYESGESSGAISLSSLFNGGLSGIIETGSVSIEDLAYYIVRGGWPDSLGVSAEYASSFASDYIKGLLQEDIPRVADSIDIMKMHRFMRSLARNESTTASKRTIQRDMNGEISDATIDSYASILSRLFLLSNQLPFSPSIRSSLRLKQMEKRHFTDPSIAAALLGMNQSSLLNDLQTFGFLFEALVERDLSIYAAASGNMLRHYQDYRGNEVDAIIEAPDGRWGAIEIKLGAGEIDYAAKTLLKTDKAMQEASGRGSSFLAVVCGLSSYAYKREDGVNVIPITALGV